MTTTVTIVLKRGRDGIWSAKLAECDCFQGEAEHLGTAVVRLIDSVGRGTVRFDSWIETERLKRDDYREFRVPLTPRGARAIRSGTSAPQQPVCHSLK